MTQEVLRTQDLIPKSILQGDSLAPLIYGQDKCLLLLDISRRMLLWD